MTDEFHSTVLYYLQIHNFDFEKAVKPLNDFVLNASQNETERAILVGMINAYMRGFSDCLKYNKIEHKPFDSID